jgi:hypothetical protein
MAKMNEIEREVVADLWLDNNTYDDVEHISDTHGPMFPGTENEKKGKDWLLGKFKEYDLENARAEEFKYMGWKRGGVCKLELIGPRSFCGRPMKVWALPRSPPTPEGGIEGEIISLGSGTRQDFERNKDRIPGKIVMVRSGGPPGRAIYRVEKYNLAKKYGAEGFIFMFGMEGDMIPTGTIKSPGEGFFQEAAYVEKPPALSTTYEAGSYILRLLKKGPLRARITTDNEYVPDTRGWNIVGDVPGYKYPEEVVLVGAHWDGHDLAQGALDDTLGAVAILNVARALARHKGKLKRTLRLVNFGVEETGRYGSRSYVENHKDEMGNIVCMIVCDGFARRGDARITSNNQEVLSFIKKTVGEKDIPLSVGEAFRGRTGNDAAPFFIEGVPTASMGGTSPPGSRSSGRYPDHTAADTVDKLDVKRIRTSTIKFAQLLLEMLDAEERFVHTVSKEEVFKDIEETMKAVEACHGACVGYRPPFG